MMETDSYLDLHVEEEDEEEEETEIAAMTTSQQLHHSTLDSNRCRARQVTNTFCEN